jgi:hypothetical protein
VLLNSTVEPGASSAPDVTAQATCHGDTPNTSAQRRTTAPAAATITATASATGEPAGSGSPGSGSTAHNSTVNAARSTPARAANRRSHPRTVAAGRPNRSATRRCPHPAAAHTNAAPITPATSARRASTPIGSSTCVTPQPPHRARRGRSRHRTSPSPRITRARAHPHGRSRPPHLGHGNPPPTSRRSTSPASLPTVSIGASAHHTAALPDAPPREDREGRWPTRPAHAVVAHEKGQPHQGHPQPAHAERRAPTPTYSRRASGNSWTARSVYLP